MRYIISAPLKLVQRGLGILFMGILGLAALVVGAIVLVGSALGILLVAAWFLLGLILMLIGQALNAVIVAIDPLHGSDKKQPTAVMMNAVAGLAGKRLN